METLIRQEKAQQKGFNWMLENLLPLNDKFKGCELILPDTVLFAKGKPYMLVRCDKDFCLTAVKGNSKKGLE